MRLPVPSHEGGEAGHHEGGGRGVEAEACVQLQHGGAETHYHKAGHNQQEATERDTVSFPVSL